MSNKSKTMIALGLSALSFSALGLSVAVSPAARSAVSQAITDPQSLFDQRSPGGRAAGALTQTKHRKPAGHRPQRPTELVELMTHPYNPVAVIEGDLPPFSIADTPVVDLPYVGFVGQNWGGGFYGIPVSGVGGGYPGTPGTPGNPTPGNPGNPDTPVTPVPEPASWAMMLVGFGLVAAMMRSRRVAFA